MIRRDLALKRGKACCLEVDVGGVFAISTYLTVHRDLVDGRDCTRHRGLAVGQHLAVGSVRSDGSYRYAYRGNLAKCKNLAVRRDWAVKEVGG